MAKAAQTTKTGPTAGPSSDTGISDAETTAETGAATPVARGGAKKAAAKKGAARGGPKKAGAATADPAASEAAPKKQTRSADETERIRAALAARLEELQQEYDQHVAEIAELQRDRFTDTAGDDQADTGSKTFEREQEISLAHSILERFTQVERALERLDEGHYGWCERCGDPIPVERLAAFPSATLCVSCKQLEERR